MKPQLGTHTGKLVDILNPEAGPFVVDDIASGLSKTCRFGGQTKDDVFYSVAEHSVLVRDIVAAWTDDAALVWAALHHDDAEAYIGDIPKPMKPVLGRAWKSLQWEWDRALERFWEIPAGQCDALIVKAADRLAYTVEVDEVMIGSYAWDLSMGPVPGGIDAQSGELPDGVEWRGCLTPREARDLYLESCS